MPTASAVGLAFASPVLTWWAIGPLGRQRPDYAFGPYHLPVGPERAVAAIATVAAVAAVALLGRAWRRERAPGGLAIGTTACLLALGVGAAAGWRIATARGVGSNVGAGGVLLFEPLLLAGLVVGAVLVECAARRAPRRRTAVLAGLAVLTAPLLWAGTFALAQTHQPRETISAEQFASVQLDEPRDRVLAQLGPGGESVSWFFATPPAGSTCDYWSAAGRNQPLIYRVCYLGGRVVATEGSTAPHDPGQP